MQTRSQPSPVKDMPVRNLRPFAAIKFYTCILSGFTASVLDTDCEESTTYHSIMKTVNSFQKYKSQKDISISQPWLGKNDKNFKSDYGKMSMVSRC